MMNLIVVGMNHKTSPIEIREKFYLREAERELLLCALKSHPSVCEAMVLSTCNRTEIYARMIESDADILLGVLLRLKNLDLTVETRKLFYARYGRFAAEHLLRVSVGLDSLILGEKQILGQIKDAAELSREKGMMAKTFNILSQVALRAGKKARSETLIDSGGSSISWAAVASAQKVLGSLEGKSVLIIGAGKMGQLALRHLREKKAGDIYVTNRTCQNAVSLAEAYGAIAVSFLESGDFLKEVDVCICSAGAPHYILEKDMIEKIMIARQNRSLLLIDISIPRNIQPSIVALNNISLLAIDDLDKVIVENLNTRKAAVVAVERIVSQKIEEFYSKIQKTRELSESSVDSPLVPDGDKSESLKVLNEQFC